MAQKEKQTKEDKTEMKDSLLEEEGPIILKEKETTISVEEAVKKEEEKEKEVPKGAFDKTAWKPKTSIGRKVKDGEINDIDYILDNGLKILESEIVDALLPGLQVELLMIGQSKGKFGGGQRRVFRQTQKKTREGNKPRFATYAVIGDNNGHIGIGYGKARETVPAREKSIRNSKLNIMKIVRGCGSWECDCKDPHTIPFMVQGKCGSVIIKLIPAPKGTGLCVEEECQKILRTVGIRDIWSKTLGHTSSKINLIKACLKALENLMKTRITSFGHENMNLIEGSFNKSSSEEPIAEQPADVASKSEAARKE